MVEREISENKPRRNSRLQSLINRLISPGPLAGMPIFHSTDKGTGEIMTVTQGPEKGLVIVHYENPEETGQLLTDIVDARDLKQEIDSQRKRKK